MRSKIFKENTPLNQQIIDLGKNLIVKNEQIKEQKYIDIRKTYEDKNGEIQYTAKGIYLTKDDFSKLVLLSDEIQNSIKK
ncbi:Transcriptional coactivator p15 [Spironucleus salmonicida]|uniref:Transcriptional coactivator p15 n=1 Tax=Spironucleus salmonicida TaxID=348837 RepID=V6LQY5_9EUKA|nr:Transcriptional coactivator p15 [Spironucleus salmonicida]|eukprot:EST46653.1 Transcriptional coactivator p15 [Spironucleus salmonicida]